MNRIFDATDPRGEHRFTVRLEGTFFSKVIRYANVEKVVFEEGKDLVIVLHKETVGKGRVLELIMGQTFSLFVDVFAPDGSLVEVVETGCWKVGNTPKPISWSGREVALKYHLTPVEE